MLLIQREPSHLFARRSVVMSCIPSLQYDVLQASTVRREELGAPRVSKVMHSVLLP